MHHTIQIAVSGLKNEKWNFDALLSFLARRRQLIAYQLNHPRPHVVGCFRTKPDRPYITICVEDYKELAFRLKKLLARQEWANLRADAAVLSRRGMRGQGYCYEEKLRGERITLSYAFLYDKPLSLDSCFNGQPIYGEIIHTSADKINRILNFIKEDLYPKSLAAQTSDERLAYLGQIFWWICQAKPWDLGDPSIAETFIRSILALKEEESPPWKTGLVPWIEVMCEPEVEKFAANFSLLFEWPTCHSGLSERASAG